MCRYLHIHFVDGRLVLYKKIINIYAIGSYQFYVAGNAAKTMGWLGAVYAPHKILAVAPVEVAIGIGDANSDLITGSGLCCPANVYVEWSTGDYIITAEFSVYKNFC